MHFSALSFTVALAALQAAALPAGLFERAGPKTWVQTYTENFNDMSQWKCDLGHGYPGGPQNWGTGQVESDTCDASNVFTFQNVLRIWPQKSPDGSWTSARLVSRREFSVNDGEKIHVMADIQLPDSPNQQGIWASFWTLGSGFFSDVWSWPTHGEFDIMEVINGKPLTQASAGLHCGDKEGGVCNERSGLTSALNGGSNHRRGQWNTYGVLIDRTTGNWKTESISFVVNNGIQVTVRGADLAARGPENVARQAWQNAVYTPFHTILNVAVGGDYPGGPNAQTAAASASGMMVRNMKVWSFK